MGVRGFEPLTSSVSRKEDAESSGHDAVFLGVNLESWWLVGVVVVLSLGLALAVWFRPIKPVPAVTGLFPLVFAAFDVAEVSHQVSASHAGLVAWLIGGALDVDELDAGDRLLLQVVELKIRKKPEYHLHAFKRVGVLGLGETVLGADVQAQLLDDSVRVVGVVSATGGPDADGPTRLQQ